MNTEYTIKEISEQTGVSIHTLRYYERIGLLDPVTRKDNGHRRYSEKDVLRLNFLKRVKATGMSIREMVYYVDLFRQGDSTLTERREILEAHRKKLKQQATLLYETIDFLDMKITRYTAQEAAQDGELEPTS